MRYHSFIRAPEPGEQALASWFPSAPDDRDHLLRRRLAGLSRCLYGPYPWPARRSNAFEDWENPTIPAGYTYLTQFLAHDCVNTSMPTAALTSSVAIRNGRSAIFELETLYGAGFDGCAHAIAHDPDDPFAPSKLPLGGIRFEAQAGGCPFRDIARARAAAARGEDSLRGVQIADDRNDNNALVSQVTTLFTLFHNCAVDALGPALAAKAGEPRTQRFYVRLFLDAKALCVDAYRTVVEQDIMGRLLHPAVRARYAAGGIAELHAGRRGEGVTREFLQTLRFGHAMVRPHYRINDVHERREDLIDALLTTSRGRPWRLPLDETWAVTWSKFFPLGEAAPNASRRIGPSFSADLMSDLVFEAIDQTGTVGLAYRDLVSGAGLGVWSVPALARELAARAPDLVRCSPLLFSPTLREAAIRDWLGAGAEAGGLDADDIDEIAADPPLLLYVLIEAAHEMQGERLGILGSLLIADSVFAALAAGPRETAARDGEASEFSSMADIVRFVHQRAGLDESAIAFV